MKLASNGKHKQSVTISNRGTNGSGRMTARKQLVNDLTEEILRGTYEETSRMPSEHQLCERFGVSRVTVRLALSDLETRGLIYRHHGKGTFAHSLGRATGKPIGVCCLASTCLSNDFGRAFLGGMLAQLASHGSPMMFIPDRPSKWNASMATPLSGVVLIGDGFNEADHSALNHRGLPFFAFDSTNSEGASIDCGAKQAAREVALLMMRDSTRRLVLLRSVGELLDKQKLQGVEAALTENGRSLREVEIHQTDGNADGSQLIARVLCDKFSRDSQPISVLAFDDQLAFAVMQEARRRSLELPRDVAVASCELSERAKLFDPELAGVRLLPREAGYQVADALSSQSIASTILHNVEVGYSLHWGPSANI